MSKKYTDAKAIKSWVMKQRGFDLAQIGRHFSVSRVSARNWVMKVSQSEHLLLKAQKALVQREKDTGVTLPAVVANVVAEVAPQLNPSELQALRDENTFLRWWCVGERRGYVDRLLKEVSSD